MRISDWSSDVCSSDLCMSWAPMLENMVHSPYPAGGWQSVGKCIQLEASNFICAGGKAAARLSQRRRNAALGPRWWKRAWPLMAARLPSRSEEHTSELQSLMRMSYTVLCLKTKKQTRKHQTCHM